MCRVGLRSLTARHLASRLASSVDQIFTYLNRAAVSGSKSTALKDLHWLLGLSVSGLLAAIQLHAPTQIITLLALFSGVAFLLECGAYLYLLINDRDALRSERYKLEKMRP